MDEQQLARIRLLSRRFLELQGLRVALAGAIMASVLGSYLAATEPTPSGAIVAMLMAFVLMIPGEWWLHGYYARTVGRQVATPHVRWPGLVFLTVYFWIGAYLNHRFPAIPAGGPTMAAVVGLSLLVAIRDWPWRAHYLGAAAAVAMAFGVSVFGSAVIDPGRTLAITLFVGGLSFVPVGLLDHWLLIRLMADARDPRAARAAGRASREA